LSSLLKLSVSVTCVLFSLAASAGDPYRLPAGAGEAGMGYACIMKTGFWSSFHNQAILGTAHSFSAGLAYENSFGIRELGRSVFAIAYPAGKTTIGAICSHFGYSDFSRVSAGLGCGMPLSEKMSAGVQIDYFSERSFGEYGNSNIVTFETGLLFIPGNDISLGIHLFNPLPRSVRKTYLPAIIRAGASKFLGEDLLVAAEFEMRTGSSLVVKTGFEYEAAGRFWFRGGYSTANNSFSFGFGYRVKFAQLDLAFATHDRLGITSTASMIFKIK
jgi:hypothetical protein